MLKYNVTCDYDEFVDQCGYLREMNYLEVSAKRGDGYSFNEDLYRSLEENLRIIIAYNDEKLAVGYHVSAVMPNPHDTASLLAVSDMFFLHPDYRKGNAGTELLKIAEVDLQAFAPGALWRTSCPIDGERDFGVLLERRLGFTPTERVYEKRLASEG